MRIQRINLLLTPLLPAALNADGTGFGVLHSFDALSACCPELNTDGAAPQGIMLSGDTLYGTSAMGGESGSGTVFALNTDGNGFRVLHSFTAYLSNLSHATNSDGAEPVSGLVLSGNTLYGMAITGGAAGTGTIFAVDTDGTGFTNLHTFTGDRDGGRPWSGLVLLGNTLYGTTWLGGSFGGGTVFAINTDGTGFTNLYSFTATSGSGWTNRDGANPKAGLIVANNTLYGTTSSGGAAGNGTVFSISLPAMRPQLSIGAAGQNIVLTWLVSATGLTLQSSPDLSSSANWSDSTSTPVIVSDEYIVTNTIGAAAQFYRLKK